MDDLQEWTPIPNVTSVSEMESPTPEFVPDGMPVVDSSNVAPHSAISENSTSADILWLVRQRSQLLRATLVAYRSFRDRA